MTKSHPNYTKSALRSSCRHYAPKSAALQLDALPTNLWPALLRADVGYGNAATMCEAESRGVLCLFKIKRSRNIQKLFRILSSGK